MKQRYSQAKVLYSKYERFLIPGMLLLGFLVDLITFKALNIRTAFLLLGVHALIVGGCILFLNGFDEGKYQRRPKHPILVLRRIAPLFLQFSMGALLSAVMIFYMFSGALSVSWPFLLFVGFLMISNEIFREYYLQPTVQLPVYYLILFALGALVLPFWIKYVNVFVFGLAGLLAMGCIYVVYRLLRFMVPAITQEEPKLIVTIGLLFGTMLGLYITNIIPPIPLSVREIGVYHDVTLVSGTYELAQEQQPWIEHLIPGQTISIVQGDPVFIYSAIFAPNELHTKIVHVWEWYNEEANEWKTLDTIGFSITGGRDDGYRGYTQKTSLLEGAWRVNVAIGNGQVLGRISFDVEYVDSPVLTNLVSS